MTSYALFETAIGWAGVAWNDRGLAAVHLPEPEAESARQSFLRRFPDLAESEPPAPVQAVIDDVVDLLSGGKPDFADVVLDLSDIPAFDAQVYAVIRAVPPGETLTYGQVAQRLGDAALARQVGQALGRNRWPIVAPCHRVTAAHGKLGGFSARGGAATKLKLLAIEGAPAAAQPSLFG
jgi:methylated-DNA-[protein]-cysteine S-methyltransferase